jgi:hypothetical protein
MEEGMLGPARKTILGLVLAASLLFALGSAHAAPSCVTGATTTTCTFSYTGAAESWVVPAGVTSAVFAVYGAAGGSVAPIAMGPLPGGSGGRGGRVQATVALTPGETLNMRVGSAGQAGATFNLGNSGIATIAGGFNGGGTNTFMCTVSFCHVDLGGGGGGASDVRTSVDGLANRLLVAGGGGGAGVGGVPSDLGTGGDSATGAKSVTSNTSIGTFTCSGGGAGTLLGPGAAGGGAGCFSGQAGDAGGLTGGAGEAFMGAGGGGYFGGGAGAVGTGLATGGGGGSDYPNPLSPPAGISNVTIVDGFQSGNGVITVTYANPTGVSVASAGATRTSRGVLVRWLTGTEADLLGFHVYRSRGHSWQRITRSLIVAKGSVSGASYRYLDRTARQGDSYRYRIKAVRSDGTATWFGPVRVT